MRLIADAAARRYPDADRRRRRDIRLDPDAPRRSGGLFRRSGGDGGVDRGDARAARPRPEHARSSSSPMSTILPAATSATSLTSGQAVLDDIRQPTAGVARADLRRSPPRGRHRHSARRRRGAEAGRLGRPALQLRIDRGPGHADLLPRPASSSSSSTISSTGRRRPLGRLDIFYSSPDEITGFWSIDAALAGDWPTPRRGARPARPAGDDARPVRPRTARPHHPREHDRGARRATSSAPLAPPACHAGRCSGPTPSGTPSCRCSTPPAWSSPSCSARACWSRRSSVGRASAPMRSMPCSPPTFAPVQGFVLAMAFLYLILNLVIDVTTGLLDPKVRFDV